MTRSLMIVDQLDPLSHTGGYVTYAQQLRQSGQEVDCVGLQDHFRGSRFCAESFRRLHEQLRRFCPDEVQCWGRDAIRAGAWLMGWKPQLRRWTAVHPGCESLLKLHQGWRRQMEFARFDRNLIHNELALPEIELKYPGWNVQVLERVVPPVTASVDPAELRARLGLPSNARLVGTAAELQPRTRIKDFIWAGDLMTCIRDDVYWLVIGDGPQLKGLQRFADHLEIGDNLRFIGWGEMDTRELIAGLDVYIQPSIHEDSCNGMLHSLANGVPIVATSDPLHRQFVHHGVNGFVVGAGARNEFARCVNRLINQPELAARFSHQSRNVGSTARQTAA